MSTIFSGINLALRALTAHQQAQLVNNHNVANANTPGYTREEAILSADYSYTRPAFNRPEIGLQLGMGAHVTTIRRFTLDFFDDRLRKETAASADWGERSTSLQQIESILPETDGAGLGNQLDVFWSAWQSLSGDSANMGLRAAVVSSASSLAGMIHDRYATLTTTRRDSDALAQSLIGDINTKATAIAGLSKQIMAAIGIGDSPNDLLDQRDLLIDQLAQAAGATVNFQDNGDALVSIGGHILVAGGEAQPIGVTADALNPGMVKVVWPADGLDATIQAGRLGGALKARDIDIPARLSALDSLASTLMTQVNIIHSAAFGLPPANVTAQNFFSGTDALTMDVNATISGDLTQLAAATAANSPGDGSQALAVAQLANAAVMSGGTRTLNGFWADTVAQLGLDTQRAQDSEGTHSLISGALTKQKQSVTGVSLDEEAARMAQSQKAYEAAARMLTAFDEMADTIINRMGVVGR